MERARYLLKNIYQVHLLAGRLFDRGGEPLVLPAGGFAGKDPVCCNPLLRERLFACGAKQKYTLYDDGGYFYGVFDRDAERVVWGPFVIEVHSEYQDRMYLGRNRVKEKMVSIPFLEMNYAKSLISFMHGILFEEYSGTGALFEDECLRKEQEEQLQEDLSRYIMENIEQGRVHSSYQREREFFDRLLTGSLDVGAWSPFGAQEDFRDLRGRQGIVAQSQKKQMEYSAVSYITLLTRHVMAAGVSEAAAYRLSDVCLQEISRTDDMLDMERVLKNSVRQFVRLVKEQRAPAGEDSPYVEQSKDYIARHIFAKLTLPEIAGELGIHPAYLSRLFAQKTGIGIAQYILQEKIHVSCNLLKYSGEPIAVVAEYVGLSPQSYYSKVFKKVMNQTPGQYRKAHRNKRF